MYSGVYIYRNQASSSVLTCVFFFISCNMNTIEGGCCQHPAWATLFWFLPSGSRVVTLTRGWKTLWSISQKNITVMNMGVDPKIGVVFLHFNWVFHYFHHPFWGTPIFGNTHIPPNKNFKIHTHNILKPPLAVCFRHILTWPTSLLVHLSWLHLKPIGIDVLDLNPNQWCDAKGKEYLGSSFWKGESMIQRILRSILRFLNYTTWKVDGASPMYWFIIAPY